ncbi:hypothetical protein N658DRAFT_254423 [Parathielavia hyrcaniae]|uniref:Uncharacterized protein n=1 Tax=Parathielavia hyrcaniae TaxID=113614 RepID=A0AAN6SXZ7_9PEZI|nr:hypothetical protein N658DRAFT_254423 [Parathielavia hyrcaniae]
MPGILFLVSYFAVAGTSLAVTGFVVQFIGLRGLHWSAAVVQLGVTLIMTVIRAIVRRGLSSEVASIALRPDDECVSFAPAIDTIRYLLTLQGQEGNGKIVKARWARFFADFHEDSRHFRHPSMVNPLDVLMTGRYFSWRALRQGTPSVGARRVSNVCTLLTLSRSLSTADGPTIQDDPRYIRVSSDALSVLKGLKGVAEYLTHIDTVLTTTPFAFDSRDTSLFWELDGPIWQDGRHFENLESGMGTSGQYNRSPIEAGPIFVWLGSIVNGNTDYVQQQLAAIIATWAYVDRKEKSDCEPHLRVISSGTSQLDATPTSTLSSWLGLKITETRALPVDLGRYQWQLFNTGFTSTVCFGLYLSPIARKPPPRPGAPPEVDHDTNFSGQDGIPVAMVNLGRQPLIERVAKELFSVFILAVVENIKEINGEALRRADPFEGVPDRNFPRTWEHPLFEDLADIAVKSGVTGSKTEARALVIPAFAWYDLLPRTCKTPVPAIETDETDPAPVGGQSDFATPSVGLPETQSNEQTEYDSKQKVFEDLWAHSYVSAQQEEADANDSDSNDWDIT